MKRVLLLSLSLLFVILGAVAQTKTGSTKVSKTANPQPFNYSSELQNKANAGDMTALFQLGYCYYIGGKTPLCPNNPYTGVGNRAEAMKLLQQAADKGHVYAKFLMGCYYYYGYEPAKLDYATATKYFEESANAGCADAMVNLGVMYGNGVGVEVNEQKASQYMEKAAEHGSALAQYNMFVFLKDSDFQKGVAWLKKAADQGHATALRDLGMMTVTGQGVEPNPALGIEMEKKAIDYGNTESYYDLGYFYANGVGVEKDIDLASIYFYKSMKAGKAAAKNVLQELYKAGAQNAFTFNNYEGWIGYLGIKERTFDKSKTVAGNTKSASAANKQISDIDSDIPVAEAANESTFAVIIANENYQDETKVDFALNDGETFRKYCQKALGLPEENIHLRKNATLNNIKGEITWMQQVAKAFDGKAKFIVFYAGHGIPDEATGTSYLLPVDGKGSMIETAYSLADFYKELGDMPAERVTVFMDACFSGSKRGEGMLASARGVAIKAKPQSPKGKMVVFSAAQGDETAYPYKDKKHGMFTYFLLKKIQETKGDVSLGDLGEYVTEQVTRRSIVSNGKSQTPTVSSSITMKNSWRSLKLK